MNTKRMNQRSGISLFEVLIAMLVAAIGVFGVILLIPFAWETAEKGIDRENAIGAAKNYFADMQAYGYHNTDAWYDEASVPTIPDENAQVTFASPNAANQLQPDEAMLNSLGYVNDGGIVAGFPYVIDPIGADGASPGYDQFPRNTSFSGGTTGYMPRLNQISFVGGRDPAGIPNAGLNTELSRRIAWKRDDLVFKAPAVELGPPRQAYFSVDGVPAVKRQYDGRYTMISFVVPVDDSGSQYRMYTLVGKAGDRGTERVFQLDDPAIGGGDMPPRGYRGILLGGGDVVLNEDPTSADALPVEQLPIRNGDWVMLINYHRTDTTMDPAVDLLHDDIQLNFYQVLNAVKTTNVNTDPLYYQHNVTLQGPDFDAFRDWDPAVPSNSQNTETDTFAILIPNVLAVYERTFRTEQPSSWTNQ